MDYNNILNNVVVPLIEKFGTIRYIQRGIKYKDIPFEDPDDFCYGWDEEDAEYGWDDDGGEDWTKEFDSTQGIYYWKHTLTGKIVYKEPKKLKKLYKIKSVKDNLSAEDMANSLVLATDSKYYVAPVDIIPKVGDIFIDDDVKYNIYYVETLRPANLTVLYTIYCRIIQ